MSDMVKQIKPSKHPKRAHNRVQDLFRRVFDDRVERYIVEGAMRLIEQMERDEFLTPRDVAVDHDLRIMQSTSRRIAVLTAMLEREKQHAMNRVERMTDEEKHHMTGAILDSEERGRVAGMKLEKFDSHPAIKQFKRALSETIKTIISDQREQRRMQEKVEDGVVILRREDHETGGGR